MLLTGQLPAAEASHVVSEKTPEASHDAFQVAGSVVLGELDEAVDELGQVLVPSVLLQIQGKTL
jgi:hypothetical protein